MCIPSPIPELEPGSLVKLGCAKPGQSRFAPFPLPDASLILHKTFCRADCCLDDFLMLVSSRRCKPNFKYELIVKEYHAQQEAYAQKMRSYFTIEDEIEGIS